MSLVIAAVVVTGFVIGMGVVRFTREHGLT